MRKLIHMLTIPALLLGAGVYASIKAPSEVDMAECRVECRYEVEGSRGGRAEGKDTCVCEVEIAHLHAPVKTRASDHEGKSYNSRPDERKPLKYEAD